VANRDGNHLLVGIASFGDSCDTIEDYNLIYDSEDSESPPPRSGVYTNVASYVDWIKTNSDYNECRMSKSSYLAKCLVISQSNNLAFCLGISKSNNLSLCLEI
jgi:hypothetical protein